MYRKSEKGEEFLKKFPKFKKWINECNLCHRKGYKSNLPLKITDVDGSLEVFFIKKYFDCLDLDENGLCKQCASAINNKK